MIIAIYLSKHDMIFDHSFQSFPVCFVWQIFFYNFSLGPVKHVLKFYSLFLHPDFLVISILRSSVTFYRSKILHFYILVIHILNFHRNVEILFSQLSTFKHPKTTNFIRILNHYYFVLCCFHSSIVHFLALNDHPTPYSRGVAGAPGADHHNVSGLVILGDRG